MSLLRRISETVKRLAGKKRERPVKEAPPSKDSPKFNAQGHIAAKTQEPRIGWYYSALLKQQERAFKRPSKPEHGGTLVWNSARGPFKAGRNAARKARRERRKQRRAA